MAGGQVSLGKYDEDQNDRAHEQSRGVNFQCGHKTLRRPSREKLAGGKEVQRCRIEAAIFPYRARCLPAHANINVRASIILG
jgi:hypothetical protein